MRKKHLVWLLTAAMLLGATGCGEATQKDAGVVPSAGNPVPTSAPANKPTLTATPTAEPNPTQAEEMRETVGAMRTAASYEELLELLKKKSDENGNRFYPGVDLVVDDAIISVPEASTSDTAKDFDNNLTANGTAKPGASEDFSDTNVQVQGIAEADIVKTDGSFIYVLSRGTSMEQDALRVRIFSADGGKVEFAAEICVREEENTQRDYYYYNSEMYVEGDKLVLVYNYYERIRFESGEAGLMSGWWAGRGDIGTEYCVYDISDRTDPKPVAKHAQDGSYITSRVRDGYLYMITRKNNLAWYGFADWDVTEKGNTADISGSDEQDELQILPKIDCCVMEPHDIYFEEDWRLDGCTILSAIDLNNPTQLLDSISLLTHANQCYMGMDSIYLTAEEWWSPDGDCSETNLMRIAYRDGKFEMAAQKKVKGTVDDRFSMDEKDGYLRLVTTIEYYRTAQEEQWSWQEYIGRDNALYVLDADLNVVGSIENLAKDERIYSARFIGDIAYFVTFRNRDPLFSVDVSDPKNPVLLGALKIPGFSDYLQPYGENLLLGIGYGSSDVNDEERTDRLKLTMFDITNPANVIEKHTLVLDEYSASEACTNSRAVLVNAAKGIIGFPAEHNIWESIFEEEDCFWSSENHKAYLVYGYDEEHGFYERFKQIYGYGEVYEQDDVRPMSQEELAENVIMTQLDQYS